MPSDYMRRLHQRAFGDARQFLGFDSGKRAMVRIAFGAVAIAAIWLFGAHDLAIGEIVLKIVVTCVIILAFPFVYVWEFVAAPAKIQAEADATIERLAQTRCTLSVDGPSLKPSLASPTKHFWRMRVTNGGPATANNVRMWLRSATPEITYATWRSEYPYPVGRVGLAPEGSECRIIAGDTEDFEVVAGWPIPEGRIFIERLDTKSGSRNPIGMETNERFELKYEIKADNADPLAFSLDLFLENGTVMMKRKS